MTPTVFQTWQMTEKRSMSKASSVVGEKFKCRSKHKYNYKYKTIKKRSMSKASSVAGEKFKYKYKVTQNKLRYKRLRGGQCQKHFR